jgi:hypothetical protein
LGNPYGRSRWVWLVGGVPSGASFLVSAVNVPVVFSMRLGVPAGEGEVVLACLGRRAGCCRMAGGGRSVWLWRGRGGFS